MRRTYEIGLRTFFEKQSDCWRVFQVDIKQGQYLMLIYKFEPVGMRNNRNTVGDQWKPPQRNISNSIERKTMTNPQMSQAQIRQVTQQQLNEKMATMINNTLLKLPNHGNRSSISNSLQPKASTMISTISSFMNSIDGNFDKSNLDIESIPQLLSFWGYPHNYNKSVFQPVGAPHTWPTCLQMMEFLAEITNYFFEYQLQSEQCQLDTEEIDLILEGFLKQNCIEYEQNLQKNREILAKQQEELLFQIQSSELTLRNIKNSQKSVAELETEQAVLLQKLQRESQNVIEIDQQNNALQIEIQRTDENNQELQMINESLMKKAKMLEDEISNQELSAEEAAKIEYEIKEYHSRNKDLQNQFELRKKQFEEEKSKIVQNYYKIVEELNQIKNSMRTYQQQMQKRNIQVVVPQNDHVAFTESIHAEDMGVFYQAVDRMIESDKIKAMVKAQQSFADIIEHEIKVTRNQLSQTQKKESQVEQEQKQISVEVSKLMKYEDETKKQIEILSAKRNHVVQRIEQLKRQSNITKACNEQLLRRQIELTKETKERKQHMVEGIKLLNKHEADCEVMLKAMEDKEKETKAKLEEILQRMHKGFINLNSDLKNFI